jgi:hypothetical protein
MGKDKHKYAVAEGGFAYRYVNMICPFALASAYRN